MGAFESEDVPFVDEDSEEDVDFDEELLSDFPDSPNWISGVIRDVPSASLKLNCGSGEKTSEFSAALFAGCQRRIAELLDFLDPYAALSHRYS